MIEKIICIGICVCILSLLLKENQKVFVLAAEIIFACIAAAFIADEAIQSVKALREMFMTDNTADKAFSCLLKGAIISISTKLACDIAKESGNSFVSDIIEVSGRIMLLVISLPFIESIVQVALRFAE